MPSAVCPSKDGLELAEARIRDYLAWENVPGRTQETGARRQRRRRPDADADLNIEKAKGRFPEAIRQAYITVVTVSEKNEVQAFKITVTDDPHFTTIKADKRARIKDTAIAAEALLPGGPTTCGRKGRPAGGSKTLRVHSHSCHICRRCSRPMPSWTPSWRVASRERSCCDSLGRMARSEPGGTCGPTKRRSRIRRWNWSCRKAPSWPRLHLICLPRTNFRNSGRPTRSPPKRRSITLPAARSFRLSAAATRSRSRFPKLHKQVVEKAVVAAVEAGTLWLLSGPASVLANRFRPACSPPPPNFCPAGDHFRSRNTARKPAQCLAER